MDNQTIPRPNPYLAQALAWLLRIVFKGYFRLECEGCESVVEFAQQSQPLILVCNHPSNLDVWAMGACVGTDVMMRVSFPGKRELFDDWKTGWILRALGGFPLDRQILDLSAARTIIRILRSGRSIGLAPEGTRSPTGEVLPFKSGFVKLAIRTNTRVLPVGISGTHEALPKHTIFPRPKKIVVRFGEPIDLSSHYTGETHKETYDELAEMVRQEVIRLCERGNKS